MERIWRIVALIIFPLLLVSCAVGPLGGGRASIVDTRQGRFAELPKGMQIKTVLDETLSSARSRAGQTFSVSATNAVCAGSTTVMPAGAKIYGSITKITPPRFGLMKAKIAMRFDSVSLNGKRYRFPGKAAPDINAYAEKGAKNLGEMGAKKAVNYFIPGMGTVFLITDIYKGLQSVSEDKEISIERGSTVIVGLTEPVRVPLN